MSHSENHLDNQISLIDEEGNEELYEVLLYFEDEKLFSEKRSYAIVKPLSSEADEDEVEEVTAFRVIEEENEELSFETIDEDSDKEWDMIEEVYNTLYTSEED